jgi:hypothetical protein
MARSGSRGEPLVTINGRPTSSPVPRHPNPAPVSLGPVTGNPIRAGTGGRHTRRTPIPSRVCSSSSTRVAKPSRRQAEAGPPLAEAAAEPQVRHIPDWDRPAAARCRGKPAVDRDWIGVLRVLLCNR